MLSITLNPRNLNRWVRALNRVQIALKFHVEDQQKRSASEFKLFLTENILSNRYAMGYARYNRRYADWKYRTLRRGGYAAGSYWVLSRALVNSLTTKKIKTNEYHAGIARGATAAGTSWFGDSLGVGAGREVDFYARINEYGGRKHPARPVFGPSCFEYANTRWPIQGWVSLRSIKSKWR